MAGHLRPGRRGRPGGVIARAKNVRAARLGTKPRPSVNAGITIGLPTSASLPMRDPSTPTCAVRRRCATPSERCWKRKASAQATDAADAQAAEGTEHRERNRGQHRERHGGAAVRVQRHERAIDGINIGTLAKSSLRDQLATSLPGLDGTSFTELAARTAAVVA